MDTVDANLELGLPVDAREYSVAAQLLDDLGVRSVRLLTNNPAKVDALAAHGFGVTRIPLPVAGHPAEPALPHRPSATASGTSSTVQLPDER